MMSEATTRRRILATLAAVSLLGLAGCSAPDADPKPSPSAEATAGLPDGVTPADDVPTDVENDAKARSQVTLSSCKATDDGWQAAGKAANPGKDDVTYAITVYFTTASATVIDWADTTVDVAAGEQGKWSAKKKFAAADDTQCVIRAVTVS